MKNRRTTKRASRIDEYFARLESEHLAATQREMERQGVGKVEDLTPTNAGAYDDEMRELAANGWRDDLSLPMSERVRRSQQRVEARHAEAEKSWNYLGAPPEELMGVDRNQHRGGGGGNRNTGVLWLRYCEKCNREYARKIKRATATPKGGTIWEPTCKCGVGYVERRGAIQLQGAKAVSSGSASGGSGKQQARTHKWREQDYIAGGQLSDLEQGETGSARVLPAFALLIEQSRAKSRDYNLKPRHVLHFLSLTPEYKFEQFERWIRECENLESSDRQRNGENGRPFKFGETRGVKQTARLQKSLYDEIASITLVFEQNELTFDDLIAGQEAEAPTFERLQIGEGGRFKLGHLLNLAYALYVWYLIKFSTEVDGYLAKHGGRPNPDRFTSLDQLRSSLLECEALCEIVLKRNKGAKSPSNGDLALGSKRHQVQCGKAGCSIMIGVVNLPDDGAVRCKDHSLSLDELRSLSAAESRVPLSHIRKKCWIICAAWSANVIDLLGPFIGLEGAEERYRELEKRRKVPRKRKRPA